MCCVQDVGKELENQAAVKCRVSALGSQLMTSRPGNSALRCRFERLNGDWQQLSTSLSDTERHVHAAYMQLVPSLQQVLAELMQWLLAVEKTIHEGSNKSLDSLSNVHFEQQKYRVHVLLL